MAKKYLNGWQAPRFIVEPAGINKIIDLNLKYQALVESVEEIYIEHELLNGSIVEKFLYAHYYWDLNYSALADSTELLKIKAVLNYLQQGYRVHLYPHKELGRNFIVTTVKNRLSLGRHYGGSISPGEKDFSISFKTKEPRTSAGAAIDWTEIADNGNPTRELLNQYYYLTTETGAYIYNEQGEGILISVNETIDYDEFENVSE